jgi:Peptidase U49
LLHEIAHVHFQHPVNLIPEVNIRQEDDADKFAARWVFDRVQSNDERERRILKVSLALAWLLLFELWGGDAHHPPVVYRLMHVARYFNAEPNSIALEVVAHLFKILFFPAENPPEFDTSQDLFEWTINLFRRA